MSRSVLRIENIQSTIQNGVHRVCADVDGESVWYESAETQLQAVPEIFACAFLVSAMAKGVTLRVEGAVSKVWKNNMQKLMELFHEWWGYSVVEIEADDFSDASDIPAGHTALFFTGGVDSFYSLLRGEEKADQLIYVHGFDLTLDDELRFAEVRRHLRAIAEATGKRLLILKTNLREHPMLKAMDWGRTHGGALASAAYCLADIQRAVISSSYCQMNDFAWGSHWEADPLWSGEHLTVIHQGDRVSRSDKLRDVIREPLVQQHLRVCWKNKGLGLNCCRCEKCVRTMIILEQSGQLAFYESFPERHKLSSRIRRVRYVPDGLVRVYKQFGQSGLSPQIQRAIRALLFRTRLHQVLGWIVAVLKKRI